MEHNALLEKFKKAAKEKRLTDELNLQIKTAQNSGLRHEQILQSMAKQADIQVGTVLQILKGSIKNPPEHRLAGFARALSERDKK